MRPLAKVAAQRLHRQVVGHDQAGEAQMPAHHLHRLLRLGRRPLPVHGGEDDVRRHGPGHVRQGLERREIPAVQGVEIGVDGRQVLVAVGEGPSMAGHVFDTGQDPARQQPLGRRSPQHGHRRRILAIGAVADDVVSAGHRHVQHRHEIDVDPDLLQVMRHQPRAQPRQFTGFHRVVRRLQISVARRVFGPVRRPHPLDPSALLIDQDRRFGIADGGPQFVGERPHLLRRVDVSPEQDEPPRPRLGEEGPFVLAQPITGAAVDRGGCHRTIQSRPAAFSASQKATARSRDRPVKVVR